MNGNIYLIQDDGTFRSMKEQPYESEDLLQTLLEKYPEVLAGEQPSPDRVCRWLLVSREFGVPGEEGGPGRWSLDHLFLDQDGIPTLVEVKRSSDLRIRREVVGQMLDYAANAVVYWPVESIRARFEARCEGDGRNPGEAIMQLIGDSSHGEDPVETFWIEVKTNLQAGKVRLVFVADQIPRELQRIVEFLNGQMDPAEVLAIEVRQFIGEGIKTLVPKLIGQTALAQQTKGRRAAPQWDEESFFAHLATEHNDDVATARDILNWVTPLIDRVSWGQGQKHPSCVPILQLGGAKVRFFALWPYGSVEVEFQYLVDRPPFDREEMRLELMQRLNRIQGVDISSDSIARRPNFSLSLLRNSESLGQFKEAIQWAVDEVRRTFDSKRDVQL